MSNQPKAGKGIDPEMLAAYIDNRLPPEQRAAVEAQLATDPDSYALLVDTLEALDDDEIKALEVKEPLKQPIAFKPKSPKSPFRTWMIAGGALAAAAAIVIAVRMQDDNTVQSARLIAGLVEATGDARYLEPRLSASFAHGALRVEERGQRESSQSNVSLLTAAAAAERAVSDSPTAGNLHALGLSQLLLGRHDDAISAFSRAVDMTTPRAPLLNDLAATYLDRAAATGRNADLIAALEHADAALAVDRAFSPAAFNRALALEKLRRLEEAAAAWNDFLTLDSTSGWADEARVHVKSLESLPNSLPRVRQ